jgi:Cu/Ag efflux pump CusA
VSTYFNDRVRELQGAPTDDVVVRIYGEDLEVLKTKGAEIQTLLSGVKGLKNARVEAQPLQPTIQVEVDLAAAEKRGIKPGDVRRGATTLVSGLTVGSLYQDQKVFQVVVVGTPQLRHDLTAISDIRVDTPDGGQVRLGDVAKITVGPSLSEIKHDNVSRSLDVTATVTGRSVAAAAKEAATKLKRVSFPPEHDARVLTAHEDRSAALRRVVLAALLAAVLVYLVFQAALSSWALALLAFVMIPLALAGGAVATWASEHTLSLGSIIGLVAVGGLAARTSAVLLDGYRQLHADEPGLAPADLVRRATVERGMPVLVAALVLAGGSIPFLVVGHQPGGEVIRPLVVSLLGGLLVIVVAALVVVPGAYLMLTDRDREDVIDA